MTTRPEHDGPPSDYQLLLPDGWFRILLDPEQRDRSVDALAERRFQGIDNAPHLKDEMRADLRRRAAEAYRGGGIELYLSFQEAGPLTIPASLLVSLAPLRGPEPLSPHDLAAAFARGAEPDEDDAKVSVEELAAGTAVRVRSTTRPTERGSGRTGSVPPSRWSTTCPSPAAPSTCCSPSPPRWNPSPTPWPASSRHCLLADLDGVKPPMTDDLSTLGLECSEDWVPFPVTGTIDLSYWARYQAEELVERYARDGEKGNARVLARDLGARRPTAGAGSRWARSAGTSAGTRPWPRCWNWTRSTPTGRTPR